METDIQSRFMKGLENYDITYQDIVEGGWYYCGGNKNQHLNYWNLCNDLRKKPWTLPALTDECVCGHRIKENCYITNGKQIMTLGNCCIKRFVPKSKRTCHDCQKEHQRKKENLCYDCSYKRLKEKDSKGSLSYKEYKMYTYLKLKLNLSS